MPITTLWGLVVSLIILALGLTYKWVENAHALKLSEKEADRLRASLAAFEKTRNNEAFSFRTEIEALNRIHDKEISDIKELHIRKLEEISNRLPDFDKDSIHTANGLLWRPNDETPFCLSCYEVNGKLIHMHFQKYRLQHGINDLKWECPNQNCRRSIKFSSHPNSKAINQ